MMCEITLETWQLREICGFHMAQLLRADLVGFDQES